MSFDEEDTRLKDLVTKTLQNNGVLGKIQAELRASVFLALEEELKNKDIPLVNKDAQALLTSSEGSLAVALIQDFLQCLRLDFSLSVFSPESGQTLDWQAGCRERLIQDLNLNDVPNEQKLPVLVHIIKKFIGDAVHKLGSNSSQAPRSRIEVVVDHDVPEEEGSVSSHGNVAGVPPERSGIISSEQACQGDPLNNGTVPNGKAVAGEEDNYGEREAEGKGDSSEGKSETDGDTISASLDKHYDEDFSGSEKIDVEEEIEEDLSIDDGLSCSAASGVSEQTRDVSASAASEPANYQESL